MVRQPSHGREDLSRAPLKDDVQEPDQLVLVYEAERIAHALRRDHSGSERKDLIGERERIAHRPVRRAREHPQRIRLGREALLLEHRGEPRTHIGGADPLEVMPLHAREHRGCCLLDLLRLGGREHKDDARRRLLEDLQERIPRFAGEHMRFVDDVDLVAVGSGGSVHRPFAEVAGVIHAAVGRGVDLDHVERGPATPDPRAGRALPAGLPILAPLLAVERHGQHARERRLARAARPAEEIRVGHPVAEDRVSERVRDVRLHGDIGETPRAVLPGQGEGHPGNLAARAGARSAESQGFLADAENFFTTKARRHEGTKGGARITGCRRSQEVLNFLGTTAPLPRAGALRAFVVNRHSPKTHKHNARGATPKRAHPRECSRPDGAAMDSTYRCCLSTLAELVGRSPPGPGTSES